MVRDRRHDAPDLVVERPREAVAAVAHATQRLAGNVVLATPVSVKTLGALLAAIVFGSVAFAFHASYARKATVIGYLVPDQGTIRATMPSTGTLQAIMVREGDTVERGVHAQLVRRAAEGDGERVRGLLGGLGAQDVAEHHEVAMHVGNLHADRRLPRDRRLDPDVGRCQRVRDVAREREHLVDLGACGGRYGGRTGEDRHGG